MAAGAVERCTVVIDLVGGDGKSTMTCTLDNAWPTKITATDPNSREAAVESIEIEYETVTLAPGASG